MMNDMMNYAMELSCRKFGGGDNTFNLACLSSAIMEIVGHIGVIDGDVLRVLLVGRNDVVRLAGGCHYRLKEKADES